MSLPLINGRQLSPGAYIRNLSGVTFDPKLRSATGPAVGTGNGNIIDGTLYLSKLDQPYAYTTISGVGRVFATGFGAGAAGTTTPSVLALPVYYSNGTTFTNGTTLTLVGVVDLASLGSYGAGAVVHTTYASGAGHSINWTLPSAGLSLYIGLVANMPFVTGSVGATRVPSGQGSPNDFLTTGTDELVFAVGATGITTSVSGSSAGQIPTSINVSSFTYSSTTSPTGPFLLTLRA